MHTVAVCGTGYVGLVTAACLASFGNDVVAYDTDTTKIAQLREGRLPFYEPGLAPLVVRVTREGHLRFTSAIEEALRAREIAFIAVGTPVGPLGDADLTYVRQAARAIAHHAASGLLVVNKSTVPVETADLVARILEREGGARTFAVASNPEFLREGSAIADFMHPDRIVIGTADETAASLLRDLYRAIDAPVLVVQPHTAEMIKYAANAFLAMKISYANELSNICEATGADVDDVLEGIAYDRRIGRGYMQPGLGFGGSCLPKDVSALAHVARSHAIEPALLQAVLDVNRRQIERALASIEAHHGDVEGSRAAVLGLSFKANTDDVRESPALPLVRSLHNRGANVCVHDPFALGAGRAALRDKAQYAQHASDALLGADFAVLATGWHEYVAMNWEEQRTRMRTPLIFDFRNALDAARMRALGYRYVGIARPRSHAVTA